MEDEIGDTIESVLHQTFTDFEYIIKDGMSTDQTVHIANSYTSAFADKNIDFRVISSKDSGIYDAMNQATGETCGEWVVYMNAGDRFAYDNVLERVAESGILEKSDVIYGDTIFRDGNMYRYGKPKPLERIRFGLPFYHQSSFTRRAVLGDAPFSLQYRVCSDCHLYLRLYQENKRFSYLPVVMSIYDIHGISSNWERNYQDRIQILEDMPNRDEESIRRLKRERNKRRIATVILRLIPDGIRERRSARRRKKAGWKTAQEFFGERELKN